MIHVPCVLRTTLAGLAAAFGAAGMLVSQSPTMLRDLNTQPLPNPSSFPDSFTPLGAHTYFVAETPATGRELFRTDGTPSGTTLFVDLQPGPTSSVGSELTTAGSRLFFAATDPSAGEELWISDGTLGGTQRVADLRPGTAGSSPGRLLPLGPGVFFTAFVDGLGIEPYVSDGTTSGTRLLRDIDPGADSSMVGGQFAFGNFVFFAASTDGFGSEPWITDGTTAGTRQLVDIYGGPIGSMPSPLGLLGSQLVFRVANGNDALWITDGSSAGTRAIQAPLTGVRDHAIALGNVLLFAGFDPARGEELWRTDGTSVGTSIVADLVPGSGSSIPRFLGMTAGVAILWLEGRSELWASDGTQSGTRRLVPMSQARVGGLELGGVLLFAGTGDSHGRELWRTDGTAAGTYLVADCWPGSRDSSPWLSARLGSQALFVASDPRGREPWVTDGTSAGTSILVDLAPVPSNRTSSSLPGDGVVWRRGLAFSAFDGASLGPWQSDGTGPGTVPGFAFPGPDAFGRLNEHGNPRQQVSREGLVSLIGSPPNVDLWLDRGNGPVRTSSMTLSNSSSPLNYSVSADGALWLSGDDLYRVEDGIAVRIPLGGVQSSFPRDVIAVGASVMCFTFEAANDALFRVDRAGFHRLATFANYAASRLVAARERAYFVAQDSSHGNELWVSDGTALETRVIDLIPGPASTDPWPLIGFDSALLFLADDGVHGDQVWITGGTPQSTVRITNVPGTIDRLALRLHPMGHDRFLFAHDDGVHGVEPWILDAGGARMIVDLVPGAASSWSAFLGTAGEEAWFVTRDGQLVMTDGSATGTTVRMPSLRTLGWFQSLHAQIVFDHDDGIHGSEPWALPVGATAVEFGSACGQGLRAPWLWCSDPVLGRAWTARGGGGPPGSFGLLLAGSEATLPILLPGGCTLVIDPATLLLLQAMPDAHTAWSVQFGLPAAPALVGSRLVAQVWVGPSANGLGLEASAGIELNFDMR